jgi:hypothetical protein
MFGGQTMAKDSQSYKNLPFKCSIKLAALEGANATRVPLKKYTPRSTIG